jgi:YfiH family protein
MRQTQRSTSDRSQESTLVLRSPLLAEISWLVHGFSTRLGGVSSLPGAKRGTGELNLGHVAWDDTANVAENRRRLQDCLRAESMRLLLQEQIHSDVIRTIERGAKINGRSRGDGLITDRKGILLAILSADCVPVLVVDTRRRVAAAFHCGWRGTARRIGQKGVGRMRMLYGSRPQDLRAAIGPGIRACCYRIGEDVAAEYESQFLYSAALLRTHKPQKKFVDKKYALMRWESWRGTPSTDGRIVHLDLVEANVRQLEEAGMSRSQIDSESLCTSCHPRLFFSHRRDAGHAGRMLGVIGIRG